MGSPHVSGDLEEDRSARRSGDSSLDPEDWEQFRSTLHAAADRLVDRLRDIDSAPVWRPVPQDAVQEMARALQGGGMGLQGAVETLEQSILPYGVGNTHPRFMGWVHGAGTAGGLIAGLAEATMNVNAGGREHGAIHVERAVLRWASELFGLPESTTGVLTSGTSMANLIALTVARDAVLGSSIRVEGLPERSRRLRAYATGAAHESVGSSFDLLGLGTDCVRQVACRDDGSMDTEDLERRVLADAEAGLTPFAVIATAGTVDTGAVDDLASVATIARRHGLWFHVDGAFGALIALSPGLRPMLSGIERADSVAFDFHKWMHVTYDCGCVLVRDGEAHRAAFAGDASYLARAPRGLAAGSDWPCDFGPELSRGFRALRVWFTLAEHGADRLGAAVEDSCRRARALEGLIAQEDSLEVIAPATLNVVCFRVRPRPGEDAAELNQEVVERLQERGIAAPSTTTVDGRFTIRACLINHRTTMDDLTATVEAVVALAEEIRDEA